MNRNLIIKKIIGWKLTSIFLNFSDRKLEGLNIKRYFKIQEQ